jgi:hypothetical protein
MRTVSKETPTVDKKQNMCDYASVSEALYQSNSGKQYANVDCWNV